MSITFEILAPSNIVSRSTFFNSLVRFFIFQICSIVILSSCKTCLHYACLSFPFISTNLLFKIFPRLYNPIYTYVLLSFHFTVNMVLSLFVCSNFLLSAFFHVQSNVILSVEYSEEHQRNI